MHVKVHGETGSWAPLRTVLHMTTNGETVVGMDAFRAGVLLGLLVGEGHFGGDGKQPHITLRMHARHEPLMRRLLEWVPGSRLYGPYHHGGRHYCQWMVRGQALRALIQQLTTLPIPITELDPHVAARFEQMLRSYARHLGSE